MKNNLFRKFLALFLTGTMLTGVGCKDYDDDIDDLKGQIDDLKGKIELKADASALQTITDKLKDVNFSNFVTQTQLNEKLAGYVESSKLAGIIEAYGYQKKSDVEKLISDAALSTADINALIKAQFTLANIWTTDVQKKVSDLITDALGKLDTSVSDADIATIKAAIVKSINEDKGVGSIHEAISKMVGDGFAGYMENYIKGNTDKWNGQVSDAVIAAFDAPNSELKNKILGLIPEGPDYGDTKNATYLKTNDLTTVFGEYDKKITAIWNTIDDLAGRIQSIVFVPTEVNPDYDVNFGGSYISDGTPKGEHNIALASSPKVKVAFRVAPAKLAGTLAKQITDGKVKASFIPEKVIKTRAAEAEVAPITYESVAVEDGKLVFTAVANEALYKELEKSGKTYAVALCLQQEATDNEDGSKSYGFEIVSPYISTSAASTEMNANFVLAKSEGEGEAQKLVAYKDAAVYPLVWNATDAIKLLSDYVLAFKDGEEIISLAGAAAKYLWDEGVAEGLGYAYKHMAVSYTDASAEGVDFSKQTQLTVDPAKPTDKANVAKEITVKNNASKQNVANVGDVLEVVDNIFITFGSKSIALNAPEVKSQVKVTGDMAAELTNIDVAVDWKYATYSNGNTYSFVVTVPADKAMDWKAFNNLPASIDATVAELPEDTKLILAAGENAPKVTIAPIKMASAESAQQFTVSVTNWLNGDGEAAFTAEPKVGATETFASISGKVTFKGLPAMSYTLATVDEKDNKTTVAYNNGEYVVTLNSKLNELLYNANKTYFANAAEVASFLEKFTDNAGIAQAASKEDVKPIVLAATAGIVDGKVFAIRFDGTKVNWQTQAEYGYNVPSGKDKGSIFDAKKAFELKVNGAYTLKSTGYRLNANTNYLKDGIMLVKGQVNGNAFVLNKIKLTNAFTKSEEAKDAAIKYALKTTDDGFSGLPTVDAQYVMTWNDCKLNSVVVTATLEDQDGKVLDSQDFTVKLDEPILFAGWNFFNGSKIAVPAAGQEAATFNVVDKILAMDKDGKIPAIDTKTSAWKNAPVAIDVLGNALYAGDSKTGTGYALSDVAKATNGYGISVAYGELKWTGSPIEGVTFKNGVITVPAGNEVLIGTPTATIEVTFTYKYAWTATIKDKTVTGYTPTPFKKTITVTFTK